MHSSPVVIIPADAPELDALARAIEEGAAEASGAAPVPPVAVNPERSLPLPSGPAFVLLGWRADRPDSVGFAQRTLAALAKARSPPVHVALFEASPRDSLRHASASAPLSAVAGRSGSSVRVEAPAEVFVIERGPRGVSVGPLELARARHWGARAFSRWRSTLPDPSSDSRPEAPDAAGPRSVPWCGAAE